MVVEVSAAAVGILAAAKWLANSGQSAVGESSSAPVEMLAVVNWMGNCRQSVMVFLHALVIVAQSAAGAVVLLVDAARWETIAAGRGVAVPDKGTGKLE